ncbi:unnamed protein product [Ceratitis capitata]|uniref:(Mediterranean fruit fly) hypothetical protein n=1 Tax=Ceratitis capitata TaxID=7213 RepID=A0A811VAZ7_CERCA|nr:unnamed protein product [Ceratitis capitata]
MCVLNNMDAIVPHRRNDKPENLAIGSQRPKQQLLELVFEKAGCHLTHPHPRPAADKQLTFLGYFWPNWIVRRRAGGTTLLRPLNMYQIVNSQRKNETYIHNNWLGADECRNEDEVKEPEHRPLTMLSCHSPKKTPTSSPDQRCCLLLTFSGSVSQLNVHSSNNRNRTLTIWIMSRACLTSAAPIRRGEGESTTVQQYSTTRTMATKFGIVGRHCCLRNQPKLQMSPIVFIDCATIGGVVRNDAAGGLHVRRAALSAVCICDESSCLLGGFVST